MFATKIGHFTFVVVGALLLNVRPLISWLFQSLTGIYTISTIEALLEVIPYMLPNAKKDLHIMSLRFKYFTWLVPFLSYSSMAWTSFDSLTRLGPHKVLLRHVHQGQGERPHHLSRCWGCPKLILWIKSRVIRGGPDYQARLL